MMRNDLKKAWIGLGIASLGVWLIGGCALVLGIEERENGEELPGVIDEETGIRTTELCVEYCDTVIANCESDNAQYAARPSCINTCNALPPGNETEPFENTVHCRLVRAKGADSLPDEECVAAGPGGGNTCGSNCEAWCHLLESECRDEFVSLDDCPTACATLQDDGGFNVDTSYNRDDVQCRIIHLGAAAQDDVHCNHARYVPEEFCAAPQTGEPDCADTCETIMGNCITDPELNIDHAVYESRDDCIAACEVLPLGDLSDRTQNTVGCRNYHGTSAALDPGTHCDHSGPTGDGHCGEENTAEQTGPCDSYCFLLEAGCPTEFASEFADYDDCALSCAEQMATSGARADTFYSAATARDEDSLQCRVYYTVKALAGDATACEKATLSATCD
jgi:hypothetical protein